jgi:bacterioferritin-associated ferredoxin
MIVCVCKAVSERHIRQAVDGGALTLAQLTRELGLGSCCGKCVPTARALIGERLAARPAYRAEPLPGYASAPLQRA